MDTPYLDKIMLAAEEVRGYERLGPRGHLEHIRDYRKLTPEQQHAHLTCLLYTSPSPRDRG